MTLKFVFVIILFKVIATNCGISEFTINNKLKNMMNMPAFANSRLMNAYLTPTELIKKQGYPAEVHTVQSSDGYLLQLHRIPYGKKEIGAKKRIPILLHHGFLCSSADWIVNGPEKSLGYKLADAGYDIWMMNTRGNTFSRNHIKYNLNDPKYWDFSFHEMGIYDLPATIDYILNVTKQEQLVYIGHSLGTTVFYVMASSLPEYNSKIILQISLAPVTILSHTTSEFKLIAPYARQIKTLMDLLTGGSFMSHEDTSLIDAFCGQKSYEIAMCQALFIGPLFGKDRDQFNASLLPFIWMYTPAGTSTKNMVHCSQLITSGSFQQYDYGKAANLKKYKTSTPPSYNLKKISTPVRLYYGGNDILSDPTDTKLLYKKFPKPLGLVRVPYDKFNHVDFVWAKNLDRLLNNELVQFINNSTDVNNGPEFIQHNVQHALMVRSGISTRRLHYT